ncbi:hypothetical protein [Desulfosarcina cetonica]|uniref:hypothetical protein n=1 Tax=Desulfosarcina cetonica TaxID=90730 RepID=UPI0006D287EB
MGLSFLFHVQDTQIVKDIFYHRLLIGIQIPAGFLFQHGNDIDGLFCQGQILGFLPRKGSSIIPSWTRAEELSEKMNVAKLSAGNGGEADVPDIPLAAASFGAALALWS